MRRFLSYANDVDIKQVLTINEQEALLDEDFPMLEDGDMFVADRERERERWRCNRNNGRTKIRWQI